MNLTGREKEIAFLDRLKNSHKPEFVVVYGRRRVGKTYLIRQCFDEESIYFEMTGEKNASLEKQLGHFAKALSKTFFNQSPLEAPSSWSDAFEFLTHLIQTKTSVSQKVILFFDELPWIASKKSGFIQALDHIWNSRWNKMGNLKLVVCGSAASWMLDNLIHAKGGLYNRITAKILLKPFTLAETEAFLISKKIRFTQAQILELYLALGGIPFYLDQMLRGKSPAQTINSLCFKENGLLYDEFPNLFSSLFDEAALNEKIVRFIAQRSGGISRKEILKKLKLPSGGRFNKRLTELEVAGFLESFVPYGRKKKDFFIKIIDEYCLFYLKWIEPILSLKTTKAIPNYWQTRLKDPTYASWSGYAFEAVCHKHLPQILKALELSNTACEVGSWRFIPKNKKEQGAQIDFIIDRPDGVTTLCEIKYSNEPFLIDKTYAQELMRKMEVFKEKTKTKKQLNWCFITTQGLKKNAWSEELVDSEVCLKDLFKAVEF